MESFKNADQGPFGEVGGAENVARGGEGGATILLDQQPKEFGGSQFGVFARKETFVARPVRKHHPVQRLSAGTGLSIQAKTPTAAVPLHGVHRHPQVQQDLFHAEVQRFRLDEMAMQLRLGISLQRRTRDARRSRFACHF